MADDVTPTSPTPEPEKKTNHLLETSADSPDPDEAELTAALKAEEDEAKAGGVTPLDDAVPAAEETTLQPAAEPQPGPTVPLAVAQDERQKRQDLEAELRKRTTTALYWKGVADGKYPDPRVLGTPAAEVSPSVARSRAIKSEMTELAKKVDAGTLNVEEFENQRQQLDDQLNQIRESDLMAKVKAATPAASTDLYLSTLTGDIEKDNQSWLPNVPDDEIQMAIPFARKDLAAAGVNLEEIAGTPLGDYRLRQAVVERLKKFGFDETYGTGEKPAALAPAAPTARPTAGQIAEKKGLAAAAPPTPAGITAPANTWTSERVDAMDSVDLENVPMSELKKIGDAIDRQTAATRVSAPTRR